ncbi:hypothetical protein MATL_G00188610 [Megalops atlanticus]|uniref:Uncharacterized protein n=1 Tax=Megalops atlanticus TaxID=7932 RepID=A0A9D3PL41_MEGAT|nr:hypothetical protein MATL_G00188610 [Megalops atlanticus]
MVTTTPCWLVWLLSRGNQVTQEWWANQDTLAGLGCKDTRVTEEIKAKGEVRALKVKKETRVDQVFTDLLVFLGKKERKGHQEIQGRGDRLVTKGHPGSKDKWVRPVLEDRVGTLARLDHLDQRGDLEENCQSSTSVRFVRTSLERRCLHFYKATNREVVTTATPGLGPQALKALQALSDHRALGAFLGCLAPVGCRGILVYLGDQGIQVKKVRREVKDAHKLEIQDSLDLKVQWALPGSASPVSPVSLAHQACMVMRGREGAQESQANLVCATRPCAMAPW